MENFESMMSKQEGQFIFMNMQIYVFIILDAIFVQLSRIWLLVTPWMQQARLPCPPLSPRVCSNSCLFSQWCYLTISFSAVPFSFCLTSFPASRSFPMSQLFTSGGQSIKSISFSISPSNEYSGLISFRIDWFDLLAVQGILKSLLQHHNSKTSIFQHSAFFMVQLSHQYVTTGKTIGLTIWIFVGKVLSLLFNMLSRSVIVFLLIVF